MHSTKAIRKDIATRLQDAREKAGYASAEAFCQKHTLPLDLYLAHEQGNKTLKSTDALRYCKLLHIPLHQLIVGDETLRIR